MKKGRLSERALYHTPLPAVGSAPEFVVTSRSISYSQ
jgi:hypothetical protein